MRIPILVATSSLFAISPPCFAQIEAEAKDSERREEEDDDAGAGASAGHDAGDAHSRDIVVTGRAQQLYRVKETTVGKLPTEPLASSQHISIITKDLIRDQGARDAQDLYRNISGVTFFGYAVVTARGFRQEENFYDGLRGDPYAGMGVPQLFNFERVEFLKGPAGMLYGQTAPGGLFNYVTKKPAFEQEIELRAIAGTRSRHGGSAEYTGPVTDGVAARVGVFYEDRNLPRYNADSSVLMYDAGLTFDLGFGRLTAQGTRYDLDLGGNRLRGIPVDDDGDFLASRLWNHDEKSDFFRLKTDVAQLRFESELTPSLRFDIAGRYTDAVEDESYHEPSGLYDLDRDGVFDGVTREYRDILRDSESWSFGTNAIWSRDLGRNARNRVLVGADHYLSTLHHTRYRSRGGTTAQPNAPTPLTFIDPAYGVTDPRSYTLSVVLADQVTKARRSGFYAMDELTLGKLVLIGGLRYDSFRDSLDDDRFSANAWTYRVGAVYRIRPDLSVYAQHATSFEPQGVSSQDPLAGGPFAPTRGRMIEGGLKTALFNGRIQSTISAYRIQRTNILQSDPRGDVDDDGIDDMVAFGEVVSKGVDVDIAADLTPDWVLTLTYAYNDTRITKDNGETTLVNGVGDRFANTPRNKLGFWTRYDVKAIRTAFAFGGDYVSRRVTASNKPIRPYFVFDASVIHEIGNWNLMVRIDNLFDKTYATTGFADRAGHFPGAPRSAFAELRYRF